MSRISHAKAHLQSALAAQAGSETAQADKATANEYELMLMKLAEDKRRLKELQSIERRAEVKATLLPDYLPWIEGTLSSESGRQDDVLMTVFVWAIDIGEFKLAVRIANYAIQHGMTMPDQYKRDVPCVLAEDIAEAALKATDEARIAMLVEIEQALAITAERDMPDEVRAKLYKAYGYTLRAANEPAQARAALARAFELHDKVGVKKDIERLDTIIKNLPDDQAAQAENGG